MTIVYYGPAVYIGINPNELRNNRVDIQLRDGYSYEKIFINRSDNITQLMPEVNISRGDHLTFPVVNGKSPLTLKLYVEDISKIAFICFTIEKFGQIPDPNYFDNAFEPILVTGDDGKEYNVIPSDQFK